LLQQRGSGKVGREVDLKEKKGNQSRKDWEKKVMDWARAGRKDYEENGHYLLSHYQKGSWNRWAIGTHTFTSIIESDDV